jgi:microcin-processing metallopeptidase PmbA/TldD-like protein
MSRPGHGVGAILSARILEAARDAGTCAAEVYVKTSASRQIAWEPPLVAGGAAHVALTHAVEAGLGLKIEDTEGRSGMAWIGGGPADLATPDESLAVLLVRDALAAASASRLPSGDGVSSSMLRTGASLPPAVDAASSPATEEVPLDLVDPECLDRPEAALVECVEAAAREVARAGEGALDVDRILATEARTSVRLMRLDGFDRSYDRTIAALSVALVPAAAGAVAVTEERSACRFPDLDSVAAARDAILRGLPPRSGPASAPALRAPLTDTRTIDTAAGLAAPKPRVTLAPRAAATLVAALSPWIARGAIASTRPSALTVVDDGRVPGRPGSAPFDGSGAPTRRLPLIDHGRAAGRIDPISGPFQRHSYRDVPAAGPSCLVVMPGQRRAGPRDDQAPEVRAAVIDVRAGAELALQIRRGDWRSGGVADGLLWEGTPAALVAAITDTLDDLGWYQVGLPIGAPSVVIEGLGPWRLPGDGG